MLRETLTGTTEPKMELEQAKNEVMRKIGRNMLLFQQMEHMLKFLVVHGTMAGYRSEIMANQEQRAAAVLKQTMGQVTGQFLENTYSVPEETADAPEELKEAYFSFAFRLKSDPVDYENKKQALASIVADRNELIHHLLPRLDTDSIESWMETDRYLDQQREKLLPEIDALGNMVDVLQEGRKELGEFFKSDEGKKQFKLSLLRQSRLVTLLGEIAAQAARPDGWTLLTTADQRIRKHAPEEMVAVIKGLGHKTLKELILATELFDITEEPTAKGGIRLLYRLKPDWLLEHGAAEP